MSPVYVYLVKVKRGKFRGMTLTNEPTLSAAFSALNRLKPNYPQSVLEIKGRCMDNTETAVT